VEGSLTVEWINSLTKACRHLAFNGQSWP
jgi:hypothetical protein